MYHYNYFTGKPDDEEQQYLGDDTTNMSIVSESNYYECDPNERYMKHHNNTNENLSAFQPVYELGMQGYNQHQNFMNKPESNTNSNANPALELIQQNPGMFPNAYERLNKIVPEPEYKDKTIHVPGIKLSGSEMLLPTNIEEICNDLQMKMEQEQEEAIEQRRKRFQGYFNNNYGCNYYGLPYVDYDNSVTMKYLDIINNIKHEAIKRRTDFNKNLVKMAHSYLGDDVTDEDIDNMYSGYNYTIPATDIQKQDSVSRLSNMTPVNNSNNYRQYYKNTAYNYNSLVGENSNMNEFLANLGMVKIHDNLEEEKHRRKDLSQYYKGDTYRAILKRNIAKRKGTTENNNVSNPDFPVLNESATLLDDGTLSISLPPWMKGQTSGADAHIRITDELEKTFEENRKKFLDSIYNLGGDNS